MILLRALSVSMKLVQMVRDVGLLVRASETGIVREKVVINSAQCIEIDILKSEVSLHRPESPRDKITSLGLADSGWYAFKIPPKYL